MTQVWLIFLTIDFSKNMLLLNICDLRFDLNEATMENRNVVTIFVTVWTVGVLQ